MNLTQQDQDPKPSGATLKWAVGFLLAGAAALGGIRLNHWYVNRGANHNAELLRELQGEVVSLKKQVQDLRVQSDRRVSELMSRTEAAHKRADLAHDRIEYYRDVLHIVAKTCPGRMRLPWLHGDPGRPEEDKR